MNVRILFTTVIATLASASLVGCPQSKTDASASDGGAATASSPAVIATTTPALSVAAASSAGSNAGGDLKGWKKIEADCISMTKQWNDALAKRDADALKSVYGARVRLYENEVTRDQAIKTKTAAFAAAKDYTQSISGIEIVFGNPLKPTAIFKKKWTQNGKDKAVSGSLQFAKEGGKWLVVQETDSPTEAKRWAASCEALVMDAVTSLPEAKKILNGPTDPAHGHPSNGAHLVGGPPESPTYSVGIHEDHGDRLVTLAWFDVDPATGTIKDYEDKVVKVDPALAAKMKTACK